MTKTTPVLGSRQRLRGALIGATILAGLNASPAGAWAQEAAANPPPKVKPAAGAEESSVVEAVVVTGYRQSLENSANAKKNTTNFIDSIFAEDIGKFPDLNLTESLQRLPGVQIDRDTSGEGTYINVRGLSAGFTVLTVNGFAISTSSQRVQRRARIKPRHPALGTVPAADAQQVSDRQHRRGGHGRLGGHAAGPRLRPQGLPPEPAGPGLLPGRQQDRDAARGGHRQQDLRGTPGSATSASCWRGPTPRRTIAARSSTRSATRR
jgi:hypothetical protein